MSALTDPTDPPKINKWALVFDFNDEAKTGKNWSLLKPEEVDTTPWFPLGACEATVPVTGLEEAIAAQAAVAHLSNNATPGAMQSFSLPRLRRRLRLR